MLQRLPAPSAGSLSDNIANRNSIRTVIKSTSTLTALQWSTANVDMCLNSNGFTDSTLGTALFSSSLLNQALRPVVPGYVLSYDADSRVSGFYDSPAAPISCATPGDHGDNVGDDAPAYGDFCSGGPCHIRVHERGPAHDDQSKSCFQ